METYIRELESSMLPLPLWGVVIIWLIVFASAHLLFRKGRALSHGQDFIVTGGPPGLIREESARLRALSEPGAAKGSLTLSNHLAVKDHAFHLFGAASFCLLLGILVADVAFFGAAFFLSGTALGYLRKAKGKATYGPPAEPAGSS